MILGYKEKTAIGVVVLLAILLVLIPFASEEVDGLEKVAEEQLDDIELEIPWVDAQEFGKDFADLAPFPDYVAFFEEDSDLAPITSGIIGIALILALFTILALVVRTVRRKSEPGNEI